jgi:hypothetical protein
MMTIIDTTSDTMTSQFVEEDINRPTGKLTDCQAPFRRRPTAGLNLLGFASGSIAVVAMSRSPHGNTFRIVVGLIRFSARFRCADRSSVVRSSFSEREDGCGACAKARSERFCTGSTPLFGRALFDKCCSTALAQCRNRIAEPFPIVLGIRAEHVIIEASGLRAGAFEHAVVVGIGRDGVDLPLWA